jgi:hypothetical protein
MRSKFIYDYVYTCLNCSDASFYLPYMRLYYKPYAVNSVAVTCVSLDSSLIS